MEPFILKHLFIKNFTNAFPCIDPKPDSFGNKRRQWYRRGDLDELSREAFDKGEVLFFAKHEVPEDIMSRMITCEPEIEYNLARSLTKEEYEFIIEAIDEKTQKEAVKQ